MEKNDKLFKVNKTKIKGLKFSPVYDAYWKFAVERQNIFFKKFGRTPSPLTSDPILQKHKFTNAYRASDRVSQYLIRNVIYKGNKSPDEVFFRILLFKTFNKIETWEKIGNEMGGEISLKNYTFKRYRKILSNLMDKKQKVFSAAYILPSGKREFGYERKHENILKLIELMIKSSLPQRISERTSLNEIYELFLNYPTVGPFLAYQYSIDIAYSELTDDLESDFVVPGPGAKDGIKKCFIETNGLTDSEIIEYMTDNQEKEFARLGLKFKSLWGRRLQLIDCQNLFCEVSKYSRVSHPQIKGVSGRTRIKQIYSPNSQPINYWYPPKWNINHLVCP